jgi:hypothetical protein
MENRMNIFDLGVHPSADIFPMLDSEELQSLADDIKANGLNHPIVVGQYEGEIVVIDGRNRREACRLAKVDPVEFDGADVDAFIVSENINRRHMTKGQKAMAVAVLYPDSQQGKRTSLKINEVSGGYVRQARTVLRYAPEYKAAVLAGGKKLSDAYDEAVKRRDAGNTDAEQMEWLKSVAPELAAKVAEEDLTLAGAIAEYYERERIAKANREAVLREVRSGVFGFGTYFGSDERLDLLVDVLTNYTDQFRDVVQREVSEVVPNLRAMQDRISVVISAVEKLNDKG